MKKYGEKNGTILLGKVKSGAVAWAGNDKNSLTGIESDQAMAEHRAGIVQGQMRDSRLIVFTGVKGGCGCSFVANSVASYLAKSKSKNVLLFDACSCRQDSRAVFNISGNIIRDIGDIKDELKDIDLSMLQKVVINLESSLNIILPSLKFEKTILDICGDFSGFVDLLLETFDLVIIDLPQYYFFGRNIKFISGADKISVVSGADNYSGMNLEIMIKNLSFADFEHKTDVLINKFNLKPQGAYNRFTGSGGLPIKLFIPYDRDIEFLYNTRGPSSIFDYNLRIVRSIIEYSEGLYNELF
jgi:cellulose biosynthesis protein BcsQ